MYKALYRECRPETFEEVLGQEHVVKILKNQLKTNTLSHAYLFCGTRGTGKTTMARLLAKGVSCLNPHADGGPCGECERCKAIQNGTLMDVIEIDAASNNGVSDIRELRESVNYPPAVGNKKIYIIDEVHMLSTSAFNALLKTLEEPPEYIMFILATTEPHKLLATILSRCMRLDFKRVTEKTIAEGMRAICERKGIDVDEEALRIMANNADGSVRDGLSILDQCLATGEKHVTRDQVLDYLGTTGVEVFLELTGFVKQGKVSETLALITRVLQDGKDIRQFMKDWMGHYRNLMITKYMKSPEDVLGMSSENVKRLREQSEKLELDEINSAIIELSHTIADARWSSQPQILLELCAVKLATGNMFAVPKQAAVSATQAAAVSASQAAPVSRSQARAGAVSEKPIVQTQAAGVQEGPSISAPASEEQPNDGEYDLEELWLRVFEEGESARASFNLMRTSTSLVKISKDTFFVAASSKFAGSYVLENRDILEPLMEKFTGRRLKLQCVVRSGSEEKETNAGDAASLQADLEALVGTRVEVK